MNFKVLWADSTGVVDEGLQKLQLPRDIETWNVLQRLKAWLQGQPAPPPARPEYNHPIDWELVPAAPTRVTLGTNKGDIVLELLPTLAPGTVASFRQLVRDGYYNGKTFHRVVPNFVIQGGCPRGDGYGSLDFSLRSELPWVHYDRAGYVGMASAGNHTEGVQFFITHSPTPHLDGNYTIFARVVQGQNVFDAIAVGDRIERVVVQQ
ncbi:MAG: peptidylprolyl isomerase [Bacteroidetes bacterium]|nr:MAG: peptidylprolyl isomerase [Bacteroidota bacterium]